MSTRLALTLLLIIALPLLGQTQSLASLANEFLNLLPASAKEKTLFEFRSEEQFNMNYVPISRKGPTFHDFNDEQKNAALKLLKACLSDEGFRKASEIMNLERILIKIENNRSKMPDGSPMRDPLNYHFCIFGQPSESGPWGWRFEGHHLSLNFTSNKNKIVAATPSFMGSNPGIYEGEDGNKLQVLKKETELGFALVTALSANQLKMARFSDTAPREIITGNKRKVQSLEPKGILFSDLTQEQQSIFNELLHVYIDNYQFGFANDLKEKINKAGIENLSFAWAGGLKSGEGHYYRIQGPMLLIEYDNTQNGANHVHSIVRDLTNDYAEDVLKAHYKSEH